MQGGDWITGESRLGALLRVIMPPGGLKGAFQRCVNLDAWKQRTGLI